MHVSVPPTGIHALVIYEANTQTLKCFILYKHLNCQTTKALSVPQTYWNVPFHVLVLGTVHTHVPEHDTLVDAGSASAVNVFALSSPVDASQSR